MKTDTRQRLIDAAVKRFYQDGFHGAAMDQILSEVGISKTAFYKHFESKDELLLASLEDRQPLAAGTFRQMVRERGGDCPLAQLRAVFDVVGTLIEHEGFQGCLFVKIVMEFPLPHEPAHNAAVANKQAIQDFVTELARQAQARDPAAVAEELCLIMEGAYTTRQVVGYEPTMAIARRLAEQTIARHVPARDGERQRLQLDRDLAMSDEYPFLPTTEIRAPIVHPPGDGKKVGVLGAQSTFKVTSAETGGAYALLEQEIPPGHGPPLHVHRHETEIFYILEGDFEITVDAKKIAAPAGTMALGLRDIPHTFRNVGKSTGRMLLTVIPGRFAEYFSEVDGVPDGDREAHQAVVREVRCGDSGVSRFWILD